MHAGTGAPLKTSTNPDSDISPPSSDLLPASCASFASIFDVEAVSPHAGVLNARGIDAGDGRAFRDGFGDWLHTTAIMAPTRAASCPPLRRHSPDTAG